MIIFTKFHTYFTSTSFIIKCPFNFHTFEKQTKEQTNKQTIKHHNKQTHEQTPQQTKKQTNKQTKMEQMFLKQWFLKGSTFNSLYFVLTYSCLRQLKSQPSKERPFD